MHFQIVLPSVSVPEIPPPTTKIRSFSIIKPKWLTSVLKCSLSCQVFVSMLNRKQVSRPKKITDVSQSTALVNRPIQRIGIDLKRAEHVFSFVLYIWTCLSAQSKI